MCSDNQLTSLDVQGLASLQKLDFWKNQLKSINVQGLIYSPIALSFS
ncbi:MAG: hypothetical protein ACTTKH_07340 [Treponema sp.]